MTSHQRPSARSITRTVQHGTLALAVLLVGCWSDGDDDAATPAVASAAGPTVTAAQISAAQAALDAQSATIDATSTGTTAIAASQTALDGAAGLSPGL